MNRVLAQEWQHGHPPEGRDREGGGPPCRPGALQLAASTQLVWDLLPMARVVGVSNLLAHNS